jgi:hypothetical protein
VPVIILEGPDGAGKTTLKKELQERFALSEGQRGVEDRTLLYTVTVPDTYRAMCYAIHANAPAVVWDRLFFSEFIYPKYQNRTEQFSLGQQAFITNVLEAMGCPIILCMPPYPVVEENAKVHEQMKGVNKNLAGIYNDYEDLYFVMPNQTIIYDYTGHKEHSVDKDAVFRTVETYLHKRGKREW